MSISIEEVKQLRNKTGVSIMQCKKALEEADGDMEKALINLTKKSGEIAAKKGDRDLGAGVVTIVSEGDKTVMLELGCETDFVANNEEFKALADSIATMIAKGEVSEATDEVVVVKTQEATQKFGERTEITRFEVFEGSVGMYVHSNNTISAVVVTDAEAGLAKQLAMHVSAQNPRLLSKDDITDEEMSKAREVLQEEVADKPADMQEKILEGKLNAYFKERVLLEQSFIIDPSQSVGNVLNGATISKFVRYGVGQE